MTQETPTGPPEPLERRLLNFACAMLGVVFWVFLLWEHWEPGGARARLERLREDWRDRRLYRRAMLDTIIEIEELPEREPRGESDPPAWPPEREPDEEERAG